VAAPSVADLVFAPRHAGGLEGATHLGEATGGERLLVRIGVWRGGADAALQARFKASTCASLIAYADVACGLIEAGDDAGACDPSALRTRVRGVHPVHLDRADLVARACRAALQPTRSPGDSK
jgi:hypothetical protein